MHLKIFVILLPIFFLISCDNQVASSPTTSIVGHWVKGTNYNYATNQISAYCKGENDVCISLAEYENACKVAAGVTKLASSSIALLGPGGMDYLYRNGSIDTISVSWNPSYTNYPCRVTMQVSGILNGSSARRSQNAAAEGFIVTDEGKILVHRASTFN
jgi:hypothetical protein